LLSADQSRDAATTARPPMSLFCKLRRPTEIQTDACSSDGQMTDRQPENAPECSAAGLNGAPPPTLQRSAVAARSAPRTDKWSVSQSVRCGVYARPDMAERLVERGRCDDSRRERNSAHSNPQQIQSTAKLLQPHETLCPSLSVPPLHFALFSHSDRKAAPFKTTYTY